MTHSNPTQIELSAGTARRLAAYDTNGLPASVRMRLLYAAEEELTRPEFERAHPCNMLGLMGTCTVCGGAPDAEDM